MTSSTHLFVVISGQAHMYWESQIPKGDRGVVYISWWESWCGALKGPIKMLILKVGWFGGKGQLSLVPFLWIFWCFCGSSYCRWWWKASRSGCLNCSLLGSLLIAGVQIPSNRSVARESFKKWRDSSVFALNSALHSNRSSTVVWAFFGISREKSHNNHLITTVVAMDLTAVTTSSKVTNLVTSFSSSVRALNWSLTFWGTYRWSQLICHIW